MKKKSLYVVTQTVIGLVTHSVDMFVIGYSEDKDIAERWLRDEYIRMEKCGYRMKFENAGWEMSYKNEYIENKYNIKITVSL